MERAADGDLAVHELEAGDGNSHRAVVLVPTHLAATERVPMLVLLHGLGETGSERAGAYAWLHRYGVGDAYRRLRKPYLLDPAEMAKDNSRLVDVGRLHELRERLAMHPFGGMVVVCPYTPNIWKADGGAERALDRFAAFVFDVLIPRVRAITPTRAGVDAVGIDGVSLGGYVSLSLAVRRLAELGAVGCVQAAIEGADAGKWGDRLRDAFAREGARPLHLLTSEQDVYRGNVERLSRALEGRGVAHTLRVAPGAHDQSFLRSMGSLEMLYWHATRGSGDDRLRAGSTTG